jgi:hypothetical protein
MLLGKKFVKEMFPKRDSGDSEDEIKELESSHIYVALSAI